MAGESGKTARMTISRCIVENGKVTPVTGGSNTFTAMLNPTDFSRDGNIEYNRNTTLGQLGSDLKFSAIKPEKISFKILVDATGVILYPGYEKTPGKPTIPELLTLLKNIVYKYRGSRHEPNVVRILWGDLIFFGRLSSQTIKHTLFKPDGTPLRALITMAFAGFLSRQEEAKRARKSSPDLSHSVEVRTGDTLPLLCYRIYKDSSYYIKVARANGLDSFSRLTPGTRIWFPPLR